VAQLGAVDAQARSPPGDATPRAEEVVGGPLAAREIEAHSREGEQVCAEDEVVEGAEAPRRSRPGRPDLARPHPWANLTAGDYYGICPANRRGRDLAAGRKPAGQRPGVRDGVVGQDIAREAGVALENPDFPAGQFGGAGGVLGNGSLEVLECAEEPAVRPAEDEDVVGAARDRRRRHDAPRLAAIGGDWRKSLPAASLRIIAKGVAENLGGLVGSDVPPAEDVEAIGLAVVLGGHDRQDARRSGPGGEFAPTGRGAGVARRELEGEEAPGRGATLHGLLAPDDEDRLAHPRRAHERQRAGEGR